MKTYDNTKYGGSQLSGNELSTMLAFGSFSHPGRHNGSVDPVANAGDDPGDDSAALLAARHGRTKGTPESRVCWLEPIRVERDSHLRDTIA